MAGQQAILNFLNAPPPGKAQDTALLAPALGQKGSPRQQQAVSQLRQSEQDQQRRERHTMAQERHGLAKARVGLRAQQEERLQTSQTVRTVEHAISATDRLKGVGDRIEGWAESVPTPGSIGLLLALIFLFLWAIVPVNGTHTRAELLWLTLTGRTTLASAPDAGASVPTTGSGSGGIGSGGMATPMTNPLFGALPIRDFGGIY